jgi:hypothetical protein
MGRLYSEPKGLSARCGGASVEHNTKARHPGEKATDRLSAHAFCRLAYAGTV